MPPKTFNAGDVLAAADLNNNMLQPGTAGTGLRVVAGKTAYSISGVNGVSVTVTYGFTFTTLVALLTTPQSGSAIPLIAYPNGAPGLTSASVRVETSTGGSTTVSANVHWIAIGS